MTRTIHLISILILVASIGWLVWSLRNGIMDERGFPNLELWAAFGLCVFVGIPAYLVWQTQPKFGPEARAIRIQGVNAFLTGLVINLVGVGGNYLLTFLPFVLIIWYGIFVIGATVMIIGSVMMAIGATPSGELKPPSSNGGRS